MIKEEIIAIKPMNPLMKDFCYSNVRFLNSVVICIFSDHVGIDESTMEI